MSSIESQVGLPRRRPQSPQLGRPTVEEASHHDYRYDIESGHIACGANTKSAGFQGGAAHPQLPGRCQTSRPPLHVRFCSLLVAGPPSIFIPFVRSFELVSSVHTCPHPSPRRCRPPLAVRHHLLLTNSSTNKTSVSLHSNILIYLPSIPTVLVVKLQPFYKDGFSWPVS